MVNKELISIYRLKRVLVYDLQTGQFAYRGCTLDFFIIWKGLTTRDQDHRLSSYIRIKINCLLDIIVDYQIDVLKDAMCKFW